MAALEGAVESEGQAEASEPSLFAAPTPAPVVEQAPVPSAPQESNTQPSGAAPDPVEAPVAPVAPASVVDTFDGGKFNPDTLPPELRPGWDQLQAAFTRKTQDVAEQRKAFEALGDINQVTQAAQLYQQLQDPQNWPRFQQEITQLMEQNGVKAPAAVAPAVPAPVTPAAPVNNSVLDELSQYPELAPLAQTIKSMQDEIMQTRNEAVQAREMVEAREHQMRVEQQQLAAAGEFQRQEGVLRDSGLNDADLNRVYALAHAHNGNLLAANEAYQAMKSELLTDYIARKTELQNTAPAPIGGAGGLSQAPARPQTFEEATTIAEATLKAAGLDTFDW